MELKKSVKADLEWRKPTFLYIGLVVSLLVVYMAFEFVGAREADDSFITSGLLIDDEEKVIQTEQPKELPPAPPPPMVESLIEIIRDDIKVEDFTINVESDQHLQVEEVVYKIEDTKEVEVKEAEVFVVVEVLPEFVGGDEARQKFLRDNLVYPKVARETGMEGRVVVEFVVEPDGKLSNFKVARGAAPALDEEALRVAKLMPKWKPGKQRGKEVRVRYTMPITFTLN